MTSKRTRKQIRKAFDKTMENAANSTNTNTNTAEKEVTVGKRLKQKVRIIDKVPLQQDEFTEHRNLKSKLANFALDAKAAET